MAVIPFLNCVDISDKCKGLYYQIYNNNHINHQKGVTLLSLIVLKWAYILVAFTTVECEF